MSLNCTSTDIRSMATLHASQSNSSLSSSTSSISSNLESLDVSDTLSTQTDSPSLIGRVSLASGYSFISETSTDSLPELASLDSSSDSEELVQTSPIEKHSLISSSLRSTLNLSSEKANQLASAILSHSTDSPALAKRVHKKDEGLSYGFHIVGSQALIHKKAGLLGSGGFKNTWRSLAVNTLSGEITDMAWAKPRKDTNDSSEEDFLEEIELQKTLQHENIVQLVHSDIASKTIMDPKTNLERIGFSGGMFMELCHTDLHAIQQNGPEDSLTLYENSEYLQNTLAGASQSAAALVYLHEKHQITHNDFKPDNIFIKDGKVKLGDFGLAAPIGTAQKKRSLLLLAPEQMKQQAHPICSVKTDIFQFGLTMAYVVLGPQLMGLFRGDNDQTLLKKVQFREILPNLSNYIPKENTEELNAFRDLAHVIERCVKTNPADRPNSMREVKEAVDEIANRFPKSETLSAFSANIAAISNENDVEEDAIDAYSADLEVSNY